MLLIAALFSACTGLRKLPQDAYLFTGAEIRYDSAQLLSDKQEANSNLTGLVKSTNTKLLWMRPFLAIHNLVKEPDKEKGLRYWMKYKLGEPPVLLSELNLQEINAAMVNRMVNLGHFDAKSAYQVKTYTKTAELVFDISPGRFYTLNSITFPQSDSVLPSKIRASSSETLIKNGATYHLQTLKDERSRIDKYLKNRGYFYFSPDYLLFNADSTIGNRSIDLDLILKPEIPKVSEIAYRLNRIYVFDDFSLDDYYPDTTIINNFYYVSSAHAYHPGTILDAVFLRPDSLYSRQSHYNTLSYLMGLGVYKFANARFSISDTLAGLMDVGLFLTPQKKMSLGAEISAAVKSNNYAGPGLNLNFKNRNTFRSAELLSVTLGGRFESQYGGNFGSETSYELTLDAKLTFPRFVPIRFKRNLSREYVPTTSINIGGGLFSRVRFYQFQSFNTTLAYSWQSSARISQSLQPFDISFTNLIESSPEFQDYLDKNPTIKRSFEEQLILGGGYNFNYSTMHIVARRTNFLINQGIELSGNLANVLMSALSGSKPDSENQQKIFDVPYSQYVRLRNEIRHFWQVGKDHRIGFRTIIGAAIPYGNSATIPYVKQFFVGGTNSVRAFRARTVGPGSYSPSDTLNGLYVDQSGDIKLEASLEYRFPMAGFLKGAVFADAGNIWLVNEDPQRPGAKFDSERFYKEFAVGAGFGLRVDITYVVVRLDFAFPLRKPDRPEGDRWIFNDVDLGSSQWRKENLIFNLAIGYPF